MEDGSQGQIEARGGPGRALLLLVLAVVLGALLSRSGITRGALHTVQDRMHGGQRRRVLRVWDWWAPSINEKFARYFVELERDYEAYRPDVDLVFQYIPFQNYEQKMATGLVGNSPPDVFQSSVVWAEGFYDRGMLLPLNGFLEKEHAERRRLEAAGLPVDTTRIVEREAFLEPAWRHNTKRDGTVFGIPQILDASCLIWNLDLLRAAAPSSPDIRSMFRTRPDGTVDDSRLRWDAVRDWPQFRRIARALTKYDAGGRLALDGRGEPVQAGFTIHAHGSSVAPFLPWCAANGANFQDEAGERALFGGEAGTEAMQFLLDLYWKDRVSPPFKRQLLDDDVFNRGNVGCLSSGTWNGKNVARNTEGRLHFDKTAFPPGPRGRGHTTLSWGNMLVISRRCPDPELAWDYVRFVCSLEGSLRLLDTIDQNSPRKDFYETPAWRRMCERFPYLWNIPDICASGKKLRHTQINAVDYASQPVFESLLLRYPDIQQGRGPYPSVAAGLNTAAQAVDRVYSRYNTQVALWKTKP